MPVLAPAPPCSMLRISSQLWGHKRLSEHGIRLPVKRRPRRICSAKLEALVFDCDGVILESEDLHRKAYNAAFANFDVQCPGSSSPVHWSTDFYDELQNQIGGGKPKMRWYFNKHGWPSSSLYSGRPPEEDEKAVLIDKLQDWKTEKYKETIGSGTVEPRPGVRRLMDEARESGLKLAVCSAATKSSVIFCLTNLLGKERFEQLDCFLAGDDVTEKKPDPSIYRVAAQKLGVDPGNCLVVEDSVIGLKVGSLVNLINSGLLRLCRTQAALGAGMNCVITFTASTSKQDFSGAIAVFPDLSGVSISDLLELFEKSKVSA